MPIASFDDLVELSDEEMQQMLRETDQEDVQRALSGDDEGVQRVKEKMFSVMSERVQIFLQEGMDHSDFSEEEIQTSRKRIIEIAESFD